MPGHASPSSKDGGGAADTLDPLLRGHARVRAEFVAALERRTAFEGDEAEAAALEEEAARLLSRYLFDLRSVASEANRRGTPLETVEEAFERLAAGTGGLDPSSAFERGAPGGPHGPAMSRWPGAPKSGRPAAQYVTAEALLSSPRSAIDVEEAVRCLEDAAARGNAPAALSLADVLLTADPPRRDVPRGLELLRRAAEAGLAEAA